MPLKVLLSRLRLKSLGWLTWLVLGVGLAGAALAAYAVFHELDGAARREFDFACNEIRLNIAARLSANAQVLHSGVAFFDATGAVTRGGWKKFVESLRVDDFLPGTQGVGFALLIPPERLAEHVASVRAEGFPDYSVRPPGPREMYSSIIYLEPFSGRNLRAFGFDMFSEPVRRAAMERARDGNAPALSDRVTLVQETSSDVQAGTLLYLPVYRRGAPLATVEQRRAAILGWVYSPYRMADLMRGTLRGWDVKRADRPISLSVYDGERVGLSNLLYDSRTHGAAISRRDISLERLEHLDFAGQRWTLRLDQYGGLLSWVDWMVVWGSLFGGIAISVLLFSLMRSLFRTREKARNLADYYTRELRESEESYRNQFATNSAVMLLLYARTGAVLDANETATVFYGYTRDKLKAMLYSEIDVHSPDPLERETRGLQHDLESRERIVHHLADGSRREVEVSASAIQFGGRPVIHLIVIDVTERKRAELARAQLADRLGLATRIGGIGIWDYDVRDNKLTWDEQMFRLYGISPEAFSGAYEAWRAGLHPDDRESQDALIQSALRGDAEFDTEFRVLWPSGQVRYIRALSLVQRDDAGEPTHMVGTNWDITDQKMAEETLRGAIRQLRDAHERSQALAEQADRANAAKSDFLANMSHEIRTPINGVMGMTALLLDTELSGEQRRFAEVIQASSESLLALINDILDVSKIEAGKLDLHTLEFDPRALIEDVAVSHGARVAEKGLEFICHVPPRFPRRVLGDPGRLRQVLHNLLGNAVKFTDEGQVVLRVEWEPGVGKQALLKFRIQDTGPGIPEDKQGLLFQKFSQLDGSASRQFGGTGLGLAISRQLATLMGGQVGVVSQVGKGSEFWFTALFALPEQEDRAETASTSLQGVHLLIVDDNGTNRESLSSQLVAWGVRVREAESGPVALDILRGATAGDDPIQLAILDMKMPGMDGLTLARAIRGDDTLRGTPLVMLTSMAKPGDGVRMANAGFAGYLSKPARQADLFGVLTAVLGGASIPSPQPLVTRHRVREAKFESARLLLAEDNVTNQLVAVGILKKLGYEIDVVNDGLEALKAMEAVAYDLVFMDVQMPRMDGFEATRKVRDPSSTVKRHGVPIVAMTANAMQGDREKCLAEGMDDYLAKPISAENVERMLRQWLPQGTGDSVGSPRVLDWDGFVSRMRGDGKLAGRIAVAFREDLTVLIRDLLALAASGDAEGAKRLAHAVKGASANVGGESLSHIAQGFQESVERGEVTAMATAARRVQEAWEDLRRALDKRLASGV